MITKDSQEPNESFIFALRHSSKLTIKKTNKKNIWDQPSNSTNCRCITSVVSGEKTNKNILIWSTSDNSVGLREQESHRVSEKSSSLLSDNELLGAPYPCNSVKELMVIALLNISEAQTDYTIGYLTLRTAKNLPFENG